MSMKLIGLVLLLSSSAQAFTLNSNFAASFKKNNVKVAVAEDSTCSSISVTAEELRSYIKPAINKFWNKVPTSRLRLKDGGFASRILTVDINDSRLCSPTDSECIDDADTNGQDVIPPVDGILISCNQEADNFGPNVLAITVPNNFTGKKIKGAVILINDSTSTQFSNLSRSDRIGVIAHEIGHAIGLGHSEETSSLMYFKVQDQRTSLGQDDIDGVTYLYPVKIDGCGLVDSLVASTVAFSKKNNDDDDQNGGGSPSFWQMGLGFFLFLAFAEILKLLKRQETRPAL
jgi:hypothetical protein